MRKIGKDAKSCIKDAPQDVVKNHESDIEESTQHVGKDWSEIKFKPQEDGGVINKGRSDAVDMIECVVIKESLVKKKDNHIYTKKIQKVNPST